MKRIPRINPFFIEIILVTLFVSLASLATLQLFLATHTTAKQTQELNHSIILAQSTAETVKAANSAEELKNLLPGELQEQNGMLTITSSYGKDWQEGGGEYFLKTEVTSVPENAGLLLEAKISILPAAGQEVSPIYELTVKNYVKS